MTTDPILARQVETNEKDIEELKKRIAELGSVDMDSSTTVNNNPSFYESVVTYEVKQCASIGLDSVSGFDGIKYTYLHTYGPASEESSLVRYQQAFAVTAEDSLVTAYRVEIDGDTWGPWSTGLAENAGGSGGGGISFGPDQPEEGAVNSLWFEPIEAVND